MTPRPGGPWLGDLSAAPPPLEVIRPAPDTLTVGVRASPWGATALAALPAVVVLLLLVGLTGSWALGLAGWLVAAVAGGRFLSRSTWITLTPGALTLQEGRGVPVVVPWPLVLSIRNWRAPSSIDEPLEHEVGFWIKAGPRAPHVAVQVGRAPMGANARTLRLGLGWSEAAVDWLFQAVDAAWRDHPGGDSE